MTVRLLRPEDISEYRRLYHQWLQSGLLDAWPGGVAPDRTPESLKREITSKDTIVLGWDTGTGLAAVFLVRRASPADVYVGEPPAALQEIGWELYDWYTDLSRTDGEKLLVDLFDGPEGWFSRVKGTLCWGMLPYQRVPQAATAFLDKRFPEHYDFWQADVQWRIWVWRP